ncbi:hypothetical protein [Bacillus atrophaeus]|uniref:hypothetical protein n=1 Tax=Bacillus atrophaeus TaxID=1452 RepID=UPI0022810C30|nr:hypothetical protein [Bacillus atrophaeus]MCY7866076.1 hypothetical protein [Bacillus spizizenii]MCY8890360.1 hypothetical protein [Bacillus spizizenii]MEC0842084.1 hypothetical protein [Bacillus spizizenii]MED1125298.1 hypothetical protein [Bacillus atrophaeus]
MKVNPSRLSTHTIMSNPGFGALTVHTGQVMINVPQNHINRDGSIKRSIMKHAQELTRENIEYLESKGVLVFTGRGAHS